MSRDDLPTEIDAEFDRALMGWRVFIPMSYVEAVMHRQGRRLAGPRPTTDDLRRSGIAMGEEIAGLLASPGPVQRDARAKRAAYRRRKYGP